MMCRVCESKSRRFMSVMEMFLERECEGNDN